MSGSCSISGMTIPTDRFPVPAQDLSPESEGEQTLVLAGGCFWCTEAVFLALDGVIRVVSGYTGGESDTANYEAVCTGRTGHAEAIMIHYELATISFGELLRVFFSVAHDPTQLNRQGNDVGPQYRSAVFYQGPEQRRVADAYIQQLNAANIFGEPVVTTLEPLGAFYPAEDYHQNFAARNPAQPYILAVARPKLEKTRQAFPERLRENA